MMRSKGEIAMRIIWAVVFACCCVVSNAAELTSEQVAAMYARGNEQRAQLLRSAEQELERIDIDLRYAREGRYYAKPASPGFYFESDVYLEFTSDVQRKREVSRLEAAYAAVSLRISHLSDQRRPVVPELIDFLDTGKMGRLPLGAEMRTRSGEREAMVAVKLRRGANTYGNNEPRTVTAYLRNVDVSGFAPGSHFDLPGIYAVTGTEGSGEREEFVIERVSDEYLASFALEPKPVVKPKPLPKALVPVRSNATNRGSKFGARH